MKVEEAIREAVEMQKLNGTDSAAFLASLRANGYAVVPVEATDKMKRAMCELDCAGMDCGDAGKCQANKIILRRHAETWEYALAAAQENDDGTI